MKKKTVSIFALVLALVMFCMTGCGGGTEPTDPSDATSETVDVNNKNTVDDYVTDNKAVYDADDDYSVVTMYLSVRTGNSTENTNYSWSDVNSHSTLFYQELGIERYRCEGLLQVGDETGPKAGELGFGETVPNAIVQVRGNTSSVAPQKSYKIKIKDGKGTWNSQTTIALNKHAYDRLRFRNKLSYDLIKTIPEMIGARTQFVHLYVRDQTGANMESAEFVDYGLFTQVEQINKTFLNSHGLDKFGQLYKATSFEFLRYEDVIKKIDDETYDKAAFEKIIEIKGDDDHTDLINMLDAVNNYSMDIEEIIRTYFDEDNYFTWMAYQLLTGNTDISSQNFYLYSPSSSQKFYFISWDNDDAFTMYQDEVTKGDIGYNYSKGVTNLYGCVLHNRVFQNENLRAKFLEKVEYVKSLLTAELIQEKANNYAAVVYPFIASTPDAAYYDYTKELYDDVVAHVGGEIQKGYDYIMESLKYPSPFFIDTPVPDSGKISFSWDTSEDPSGGKVTYSFTLAKDPAMTEVLVSETNLTIPNIITSELEAGQYFIKVTSTNEAGYTQTAMEIYDDINDNRYFGVTPFYVNTDASISR